MMTDVKPRTENSMGHSHGSDHEAVDATLQFIAQRAWSGTDDEFFEALVSHLAESLGVAYAFVDRIIGGSSNQVETVALYAQGSISQNITYELAGTPCENVVGRTICCYVDKVQQLFPEDELLVQMDARSYAGIPLWSSDGEPIGLVAVMDVEPLANQSLVERLLQIVALRAAAVLERRTLEAELRESRQRFRDFAEASSDWFWEMDEDLRYSWFSPNVVNITGVPAEWHYGKTREDLGAPPVPDEVWREHLDTLRRREPYKDFVFRREGLDGHKWIRSAGVPVFDKGGVFRGYRGTGSDVTREVESRLAEEKAHNFLASAIDGFSGMFALWGPDDRMVFCNEQYREMNSLVCDTTVPGTPFADQIRAALEKGAFPEAEGREEVWFEERMEGHRNPGGAVEIARQDGSWLLLSEQKLADGSTVTISLNITARKNAERALREREALLESIFENLPVGLLIKGPDHTVRRANRTYSEWYGLDLNALVGHRVGSVENFLGSSDTSEAEAQEKIVLDTGENNTRTVVRRLADGKQHTLEITKFPIRDQSGRIIEIGSVSVDLTKQVEIQKALEEGESRFRDFASASADSFWEQDETLRFTWIRHPTETQNLPPPEELVGKTRWEAHGGDAENDPYWRAHRELLEARQPFRNFIYSRNLGTQDECYWSASGVPVFTPDGTFAGYRGNAVEITESKHLEQRLQQSQRMEAVGQLTGGVAHDFNNVMATIMGNADFLADLVEKGGAAYSHVEDIVRAIERGAALTEHLLAFSRQQALEPAATDIGVLITNLKELLQRTLGETVVVDIALEPTLREAMIDPNQFENALINLAINARDAMPNGGALKIEAAKCTLDAAYAEQQEDVLPGDYIRVSVHDTGVGMTPEVREKAFEPFFTTKEVGAGSGLGLSMVYGFVKQSKGHIAIADNTDAGTTVTLFLPRASNEAGMSDRRCADDGQKTENARILVVEDNENVRNISVKILDRAGYDVVEAGNSQEAFEKLDAGRRFDLLFTDVILPGGMNGVEIAEQVRIRQPDIKVLYTTGYSENAVITDGQFDKGISVIKKPFRRAALLEKVLEALM